MYIGLDIGTTTLSAVALDTESGGLLAHRTTPNRSGLSPGKGRTEADIDLLQQAATECLASIVADEAVDPSTVRAIGVTGQQHGVAFLDPAGAPLRTAITWQDVRAQTAFPGSERSYVAELIQRCGGPQAFRPTGCMPAAGFLGTSLFWLHENDQMPAEPFTACFIPDAIVTFLTGAPPACDPTLAASSGVFDIVENRWATDLLAALDLPETIFPAVGVAGQSAGGLRLEPAQATGLPGGLPVAVALGDNQASFIGSVREPATSLGINVGTGGQISARTDEFHFIPGLENRPFPEGHYLLIGGGLFGGRSYAYLLSFFQQIGGQLFDGASNDDLYERMTALAGTIPAGSDGLRCAPFFTGSRVDPGLRASFTGLSPDNFTPGHFARALLEGMAEGFFRFGEQMAPVIGPRATHVGAGNGVRRNRLLAEILAARFGAPLHIPALAEEAALGAAILAAVGQGEFGSLDEATSRLLRYAETVGG